MSIEHLNVIDFASRNPQGNMVLTVVDHWDWSDITNHLITLQKKLNSYFLFIKSGDIFNSYNDLDRNSKIYVSIYFKYYPCQQCLDFIEKAKKFFLSADAILSWKHEDFKKSSY